MGVQVKRVCPNLAWLKNRKSLVLISCLTLAPYAEMVGVFYDMAVPQITFAAVDVKKALEGKGFTVESSDLATLTTAYPNKKVVIALSSNTVATTVLTNQSGALPTGLGEQAYALRTTTQPQTSYWVLGGDNNGAMYGGLQVAENIGFDGFTGTYSNQVSPTIMQRGIKLNVPLDARLPTYGGNDAPKNGKPSPKSTAAAKAIPNVWDMKFWTTWLDEMARNRYNVLSVWVNHPFPALVKVPGYENICLPFIQGFDGYSDPSLTIDKRIAYWRQVMTYAHQRGFAFQFFTWNVHPDWATDVDSRITEDQTNNATTAYISKSMAVLLETYPELDGFGISAGDGMTGPDDANTSWTWASYGVSTLDYIKKNPNRNFTIIHRALAVSLSSIYKNWAPLKALTSSTKFKLDFEFKYSNAHMYSTVKPQWYESDRNEALVAKQPTWLTLRNEDFHYLNWGDPKFVRDYIDSIPNKEIIRGYYIGSDTYSPTLAYFYKNNALNGKLEVQRNWYQQLLWGRIAYDRQTSDEVLKNKMSQKFSLGSAENLFTAWAKASRPLPKVLDLTQGTWPLDANMYLEANWGITGQDNKGDRIIGFHTINEMVTAQIAKGSKLCPISTSALNSCGSLKNSYLLADEMEADAKSALDLINPISSSGNSELEIAISTVKQLAYLSNYYAYKIRAATFKKAAKTSNALDALGKAYCWWTSYSNSMDAMYIGNKYKIHDITPDWHYADSTALREYTDLGGSGKPSCTTVGIEPNTFIGKEKITLSILSRAGLVFNLPANSACIVSLFNSDGKKAMKDIFYAGIKGRNQIRFSKNISMGVYFVQVKSEAGALSERNKFVATW
jgi:hypothetical protein